MSFENNFYQEVQNYLKSDLQYLSLHMHSLVFRQGLNGTHA